MQPHHSGILNFNSNLGCANTRIKDGADVAHVSLEGTIGVRAQDDVSAVAHSDVVQVILVHVANHPDR